MTPARALIAQSTLLVAATAFFGSYRYDADLLDPNRGGPLVVYDRNGVLLRSVSAKAGRPGRAAWVPVGEINGAAVLTLLASEDQSFFDHNGVDLVALGRGVFLTVTSGRRFGGSTLTMQLARNLYSQGRPRTVFQKLLEIRAAWGLERRLSKREILEQYLNRVYYGHGAYGIEAAAQLYFGKPARSLSAGEATFLSVLPRGPSHYDPFRHRGRALARRRHLFGLLVRQGRMTAEQVSRAEAEPLRVSQQKPPFRAPHFVDWVLSELPAHVRAAGGAVHSTVDVALQEALERRTREHVNALLGVDVRDAGVVVLDAQSGEVRGMVGSPDYRAAAMGALNIVTWRRYPGSALKPFVYATAIEQGAGPASIALDVRDISTRYRDTAAREHGPVSYREALAGSYNFAAIHVIEQLGVEPVMRTLHAARVGPLAQTPAVYGSRLALGSTKVRLLDLTAAYRSFVYAGNVLRPRGVSRVDLAIGAPWRPAATDAAPVFSEQTAWLTMDMLSDPEARRPMFGDELPVDLPYRVVAKTGTAEGFADTVAIIATEQWLVGAWAGRFDGGATKGQAGMAAAAPLARAALLLASRGAPQTLPTRPPGLVDQQVCTLSGYLPGAHCPHVRRDTFRSGTEPTAVCDQHPAPGEIRYPHEAQRWARRLGVR